MSRARFAAADSVPVYLSLDSDCLDPAFAPGTGTPEPGGLTSAQVLTLLEEYNGLGYAMRGVPSPYIWAATEQYRSGKYIADGHYDPDAVDHQLGCAALLARMAIADKTVYLGAFS